MKHDNPFKMFGFHPRAFKNLHDGEIFALVKAQYRALMQIHHPDVGKRRNDGTVSQDLSNAFSQINRESDPAGFQYWKDEFLKSERVRRQDSRNTLSPEALALKREQRLQNALIEYLQTLYVASPKRLLPTDPEIAWASVTTVNAGCAMLLNDPFKESWLARHRISTRVIRKEIRGSDPTLFELEVTNDGLLIYRKLVAHHVSANDSVPEPKHAWIHTDKRGVGTFWRTHPERVKTIRAKIVGSIRSDILTQFWDDSGSEARRVIESGLNAEETAIVESTGYTTDQVRPYLWFLGPTMCLGNIVVAMSPAGDKFLFLGKLFKVAACSKAPK